MIQEALLKTYQTQFDNLKSVVEESENRSLTEPPDALFYDHQNVFIKSYLVSACSILEAFIQDLAVAYVEHLQAKINSARLPLNLITWIAEHEKAKLEFKAFEGNKGRKDIEDMVSPNYWKTMKAFERIGVDLSKSGVAEFKDFIASTIEKRNKVVHHNDSASDLSFKDIINTVDTFEKYSVCIFVAINGDPFMSTQALAS